MSTIHEIKQHIIVDTPFGKAQALMIIDYGIHLNTIWVCANYLDGKIRHFDSNQISLETNYTIEFNTTKDKNYERRKRSKRSQS